MRRIQAGSQLKDAMKKLISFAAALVAVLALATTAYGQNSSVEGYNDNAGQLQAQVQSGGDDNTPPAAVTEADSGALPFTGLDVALLVSAGGLLVLAGLGVRRLTRAPELP
jgi:hypothetical protein